MRRRRPYRKGSPRTNPGGHPVGDGPRRQLRRAHHLMETGQHTEAAFIFERLARGAHDRGLLRHTSNLYLQAGRANLLAGSTENGSELIQLGLSIIADGKHWPALARQGQRVIDELKQLGYVELSDKIATWLLNTLPEPLDHYQQIRQPHRLPLKCPYCGGALRPDEVEMLDHNTGECPYCGSAIRGER